jgi:anaerobic selenocysteine-containing dehydrogenase
VLPATTFMEHTELSRGYGAYVLHAARPVVPPVGEARSNHVVFSELVRRLGLARAGDPESEDAVIDALLASAPDGARLRADLARDGQAFPAFGAAPVQLVDVFPRTPSGKIELFPPALDAAAPAGLYGYEPDPATAAAPLALISPASGRTISSTFGQLVPGPVPIEISPEDARRRGITNGDRVRVFNTLGEVRCRAAVNADLRGGVVMLPKGLWSRHTDNGATANTLCPDTLTDLGGGACFNDARVEIERID